MHLPDDHEAKYILQSLVSRPPQQPSLFLSHCITVMMRNDSKRSRPYLYTTFLPSTNNLFF